jgi:uncharacterized damage-inducible protein DinB
MNLSSLMKDYSAYNLWSNRNIVGWLKSKPAGTIERQVPSSFPNLKQTLFHILYTEESWLSRLKKVKPEFYYGQIFNGESEELFDGVLNQSTGFYEYVDSLPENSFQENYQFSIPNTGEFDGTASEMIQHCINHSSYHRGQIVTMARNVGLTDPPMTDYMLYIMQRK